MLLAGNAVAEIPDWARRHSPNSTRQASDPRVRIFAENSPLDLGDHLKERGYRWSDGSGDREILVDRSR